MVIEMVVTRFDGMDLVKAQELYRELILKYHPDNSETGDLHEAQNVNAEWQAFTAHVVNAAFAAAENEREGKTGNYSATVFAEMLRHVVRWPITIEIIGFWIYAFNSYEYREQLKELGFWFSAKHRAWIYSGRAKMHVRGYKTTDENRAKWGSQTVPSEYTEDSALPASA